MLQYTIEYGNYRSLSLPILVRHYYYNVDFIDSLLNITMPFIVVQRIQFILHFIQFPITNEVFVSSSSLIFIRSLSFDKQRKATLSRYTHQPFSCINLKSQIQRFIIIEIRHGCGFNLSFCVCWKIRKIENFQFSRASVYLLVQLESQILDRDKKVSENETKEDFKDVCFCHQKKLKAF